MKVDRFLDIEKKHNLYDMQIDDVHFWIYHRFDLWNYTICLQQFELHRNSTERSLIDYLKQLFRSFRHQHIPYNIDVLFLSHERRIKNENHYDCIYTDALSNRFESHATIESPFRGIHYHPTVTENLIYDDHIRALVKIKWILYKTAKKKQLHDLKNQIKEKIESVIEELEHEYSFSVNCDQLAEKMAYTVITVPMWRKSYEKLLDRLNPKMIIEVVHYNYNKMIMNEIAKERHIPIIELQHGTIYEEHIAYQYALPTTINQFPDQIFLFSDFWKKRMRAPISEDKIISVGYPWFEEQLEKYKKKVRKDHRYTILFVSQKTIGNNLCDLAVALGRILPKEEYRLLFKLHPGELNDWKDNYAPLRDTDIEVLFKSEDSLYSCFSESDMQIGVYSTAVYEGLGFCLDTLILRVGHYSAMKPLIDAGYAKYIDTVEDVLQYLRQKEDSGKRKPDFWKKNSLENMINIIKNDCPEIRIRNE